MSCNFQQGENFDEAEDPKTKLLSLRFYELFKVFL